jgi:hypothetical protein
VKLRVFLLLLTAALPAFAQYEKLVLAVPVTAWNSLAVAKRTAVHSWLATETGTPTNKALVMHVQWTNAQGAAYYVAAFDPYFTRVKGGITTQKVAALRASVNNTNVVLRLTGDAYNELRNMGLSPVWAGKP